MPPDGDFKAFNTFLIYSQSIMKGLSKLHESPSYKYILIYELNTAIYARAYLEPYKQLWWSFLVKIVIDTSQLTIFSK